MESFEKREKRKDVPNSELSDQEILAELCQLRCNEESGDSGQENLDFFRRRQDFLMGILVSRYSKLVLARAQSKSPKWMSPEELAQETWIKLLGKVCDYRKIRRFKAWLILYIVDPLAQSLRESRDLRSKAEKKSVLTKKSLFFNEQTLSDEVGFQKLFQRLPREEREVLLLLFYQDLTVLEASNEIGISVSTIRRLNRKALNRLKEEFKKENAKQFNTGEKYAE